MNTNTVEQAERLKELGMMPYFLRTGSLRLTLDELHRVFERLHDSRFLELNQSYNDESSCNSWELWILGEVTIDFPRTKNHAEDWTEILIWLLENNHVTAQAVNEALA